MMVLGRDTMNTLMTLTMMFFVNVIKTTGDCPRSCECKWKSGKESVLCINANMTEIPKLLDSGTQLLDLSGNHLQKIGADEFFNASLLNLQKIFLSRCRLRIIDRCSFRKIINLVELDLSFNDLHSVPSHTFEFINELRELKLNGNPIIRVLNHAFKMVPRLTKLDLSECKIGYVEIKAFQGLETSLEWLKLDKNKITNIKPQVLVSLVNLHGLELAGNTWNCSCGLRALREWMLKQNVPYSIPPVCKHPPRLSGKIWDKLDLDEFACAPRIEAVAARKNGEEGSNVTLSCSIDGVPEPKIRWLKKNQVIGNLSGMTGSGRQKFYFLQLNQQTSSLTILTADVHDNGVYVCRAENKAGKSEANVTLTITAKPLTRVWSSKMIMAVGAVSLLFAIALGLLTYCAWTLRKRKMYFRHPETRQELIDGYEMNHKKPISYDKIVDYGNHCSSNAVTNVCRVPGRYSRSSGLGNTTSEAGNGSKSESEDLPAPAATTQNSSKKEERLWTSLRMSDVEDRLSESSNSRLSPDLHISRHEPHQISSGLWKDESQSKESPPSYQLPSSCFHLLDTNLEPHYLHPEKTRENSTYYTSATSAESQKKFPDLLELSRNDENVINNNFFFTMPRKRSYKMKRIRHGSYGSESQSPLLPGSSGDSGDSTYSTRHPSVDLCGPSKNTSLPTSPNQTPILNLLGGSPDIFTQSPTTLKYKSWELEKFLKEYRNLQDQLYKMKESCENLKEDNLKFRESSSSGGNKSTAVESATISKLISPGYSEKCLFGVNKTYLDESNNFDSVCARAGYIEEDNNNPKSILKNKGVEGKPGESFWSSGGQFLNSKDQSSGNSFYQS